MAGNNYLLDTVIVAAYFNQDISIQQKLQTATVYVPSIAIGELYFGAYHSQRVGENTQKIETFSNLVVILPCDGDTGMFYGQIKHQLRLKGRPIPENDIWIAAIALQYALILVSRDNHFKEIDHLSLETW